jgi:type IV pilus assembly protein PilC
MDFEYVATTDDSRLIRGKISAKSEGAATDMLSYSGYRIISLRQVVPRLRLDKLREQLTTINPTEVIMFSRQLALLLESGTDVVTALDLLGAQITNRPLRRILAAVVSDVRSGSALSDALRRHPRAFPTIYHRLAAVGERTGNLETVLRRAADYMERSVVTRRGVKNALIYPTVVLLVAIGVVGVMVGFVLPAFASLYASLEVELPASTRALLAVTEWSQSYGLWLLAGIGGAVLIGFVYIKTPAGKYQWGTLMLRLPRIGRINLLNELSRASRAISLLYGSGLPLPDAMTLIIQSTSNSAMERALTNVQQAMIAGQGLSAPMRRSRLFLPLMVQMAAVGEETGNLDSTMDTVAESYEAEADDKTRAMISLITPAMTVIIGGIVGFIAVSMFAAMYSIYGQVSI